MRSKYDSHYQYKYDQGRKPQIGHMAIVNETIEIDPQSVAHGIA